MTEHMGVRIEAWPLAADDAGIWLLADDAWRTGRVAADSTVHGELELLTYQHTTDFELTAILEARIPFSPWVTVNHSTSWREVPGNILLTYAVVFDGGEHVQDAYADARPVTFGVAQFWEKPERHDPAEPPASRKSDVLLHTLRHLRFLYDTDADAKEALGAKWGRHLQPFTPVLAGLYQ